MRAKKIVFSVCSALLFLLMLAVLELNRNTLWGWGLAAVAAGGFWFVYVRFLTRRAWFVRAGAWVGWIVVFAVVVAVTWPPVRAVPAVEHKNPDKTGVIALSDGQVRGVMSEDGRVEVYAGIPYAKPPVGELRWREPQDPDPWEGVLEADHFGPMSMQPTNLPLYDSLVQIVGYHDFRISLSDNSRAPVSEDSLYLNVWKPAGDAAGLPVLVYVHGGSLKTGQTWYGDYNGESLARRGVVVVNFAYRLGVFGYLATEELAAESPYGTTGNYGLLDQIKALEWVRDNIAAFGGDPANVTLAGESAGAASVSALCTSPLAAGLFERVVLESSTVASVAPPHSFRLLDEALESGRGLMARHGCATVEELRALPAEKLAGEAETQHHMTVDGYALTETPHESYLRGAYNEKQILHGYNSRESGAFLVLEKTTRRSYEKKVRDYFGDYADEVLALYPKGTDKECAERWALIWGAVFFDYPHYCLNRLAVQNGIPVYEYYFSKDNGRLGPWHSGEEIYLYGNIPDGSRLFDARDRELSAQMTDYLIRYVTTGDPNGEGLPAWEQNLTSTRMLEWGETTAMTEESKLPLFEILDRMDGWGD
ncbi:MAG: carboxylesterase family protein [Clostridia bacterium]|nr:carboxylesterase family protein [Clostridia bacterium]